MKRKRLGLIAIAALGVSCGPATNPLPVNDFNRPTDVAFMCFGAFQQASADGGVADGGAGGAWQVSGRPMQACHPQGEYDPGATIQTRTFAFLPNSAAGTLSAVDGDHWKLLDLDVDTGGYGTAPLGQLPEQISASSDGCRLISANRGSCDLTLVDPAVLVATTFQQETGGALMPPSPRTASQNFRPIKEDGTLLTAAPYEAVFLPQDTSSLLSAPLTGAQQLPLQPQQLQMCGDSAAVDPVGWLPHAGPNSWYVLVTYPSCDLITMVELPSGRIVSSAYVVATKDANGQKNGVKLVAAGKSPVCVDTTCAGQALSPTSGTSDAALGTDGAAPVDAHAPLQPEAGISDGATTADAGSGGAGLAGSTGAGGTAGSGGTPGTGGTPGMAGASGADAGATGGSLGNQNVPGPYVGSGPIGPSGIAIVPDGSRAYVSLANASFVISVGLTSVGPTSGGLVLPENVVPLNEGARGSQRVRLSVDPNRTNVTGIAGVFVGSDSSFSGESANGPPNFAGLDPNRRYLYVIARDGTLRVIQVANAGSEMECETNADPLRLPAGIPADSACIPVNPAYRRPFSVGPGIHFPSLPIDIAAADIQNSPPSTNEQTVNGAYAWVITDSGIVYLVNINPILRSFQWSVSSASPPYALGPVTETPPFVNTLRDRNEISYSLTLDPSSGPPRVDVLPSIPVTGPYIEPFWTQGSILNATAVGPTYVQTAAFFTQEPPNAANINDPIDRRAITAQTWTVSWEGPLSGVRNSGQPLPNDLPLPSPLPPAQLKTDSLFQDGGANYCAMGVVPGDLVTLTGCTDSSQCGLGEQCVFGDGVSSAAAGLTVTGICVDPNRAGAQAQLCTNFLNSVRRYEVETATQTGLVVRPHLDEIVLSSLTPPCHPATATDADSCPDTMDDLTSANFQCVSKYPGTVTGPRCLMPCALSSQCRAGRLCVNFDTATTVPPFCAAKPDGGTADSGTADDCACKGPNCFCADAPPFDHTGKACFDQLVNYQVNAGKTFLVAGSQAGFVTTGPLPGSSGNPGPTCYPNPTPDARFSFRIPLSAPTCINATASLATIDSRLDPDAFAGNSTAVTTVASGASTLVNFVLSTPAPADPCLYLGGPTAGDTLSDPTSSNTTADAGVGADGGVGKPRPTHVRALFQNSQLSFVLANLDRSPTSQFVTSFDVHGGFAPQVVQDPITLEVSMPARIVVGPVDSLAQLTTGMPTPPGYEAPYLFVVDQHRLGLEQGGGPTRGQLLRINPFGYAATVGSVTGYQPIFEDFNASGGLFPIQ